MFSWLVGSSAPTTATQVIERQTVAPLQTIAEVLSPHHAADEMLIFDIVTPADQPFVDLFDQQTASFWSSSELKFSVDAGDLAKLPPKAAKLFEYILAFFATADGEVLENAVVNFLTESESLSIRMAYTAQVFFESIHIKTYAAAMTVYIPDSTRRTELTMAFKTDPLIKERDSWMTKYIGGGEASDELFKAKRLIAFSCAEGLFFMSAFLVIAWLRSIDMFPIFARANELIARDEWMHVRLGIARFRRLFDSRKSEIGLTNQDITEIVKEAVELETRFATSLIPSSEDPDRFDGLRLEHIILHIQNLGNKILDLLGLAPQWQVDTSKLPPWVKWIEMQSKNNFYETAVTSYTIPSACSADPTHDEDF